MTQASLSLQLASVSRTWPIRRVDEVFAIQQGKQVSKANRQGDNQCPFLRTKNVLWGYLDLSELDSMHFSKADEERLSLQDGDLLLCEGGDVGRTAIWRKELARCYYQNHLHRLRKLNGDTVPEYALYWFWYAFQYGNVYFGRHNVTTIPNMSKSRLGELPIPMPPRPEQRRIAAVLAAVQRAVEQQEGLIGLTAEMKRALMHKLFTEGTGGEPQKQTEIGLIPRSWDVVPLGGLTTTTQYGLSVRAGDSGAYPMLRMTNQVEGKIEPNDLKYVDLETREFQKFRVHPGNILFNRTNSFELVGRTAIFDLPGDYVFASYLIRVEVDRSRATPYYVNHYLNWEATQARLKGIATRAVSQSNISATRLKSFCVPIPPLGEQDEIVERLDILDLKCSQHRQMRLSMQSLFRTLLHELMTAERRVDEVDLSELEALGIEVD